MQVSSIAKSLVWPTEEVLFHAVRIDSRRPNAGSEPSVNASVATATPTVPDKMAVAARGPVINNTRTFEDVDDEEAKHMREFAKLHGRARNMGESFNVPTAKLIKTYAEMRIDECKRIGPIRSTAMQINQTRKRDDISSHGLGDMLFLRKEHIVPCRLAEKLPNYILVDIDDAILFPNSRDPKNFISAYAISGAFFSFLSDLGSTLERVEKSKYDNKIPQKFYRVRADENLNSNWPDELTYDSRIVPNRIQKGGAVFINFYFNVFRERRLRDFPPGEVYEYMGVFKLFVDRDPKGESLTVEELACVPEEERPNLCATQETKTKFFKNYSGDTRTVTYFPRIPYCELEYHGVSETTLDYLEKLKRGDIMARGAPLHRGTGLDCGGPIVCGPGPTVVLR